MSGLEELLLSHNALDMLPYTIASLTALKILHLAQYVTPPVPHVSTWTHCTKYSNSLPSIPDVGGFLTNLSTLDLRHITLSPHLSSVIFLPRAD